MGFRLRRAAVGDKAQPLVLRDFQGFTLRRKPPLPRRLSCPQPSAPGPLGGRAVLSARRPDGNGSDAARAVPTRTAAWSASRAPVSVTRSGREGEHLSPLFPFQKGFTPLHVAAKYGSLDVAKLLLHRRVAADSAGKVRSARVGGQAGVCRGLCHTGLLGRVPAMCTSHLSPSISALAVTLASVPGLAECPGELSRELQTFTPSLH